jgi:hypothetical protein
MSALFDLHTDLQPEFATTPNLTAMPSSMGERFSAEYSAGQTDDNYWNVKLVREKEYGKVIDDIHSLSGERLRNPFDGIPTQEEIEANRGQPTSVIFQKRRDLVHEKARALRDSMPEGGYGMDPGFLNPEMIDPGIATRSRGTREAAAKLEGTGGGLGAFAGGAVAGTLTPHGIWSMFFPAARAPTWLAEQAVGGFVRSVGREAVYQGATQAGAQVLGSTLDYSTRSQFGTQQTAGEFAGEVLGAGVAGAVIGGAARAAVPAWLQVRRAWGRGEHVPTAINDSAIQLEGKAIYGDRNPLGVSASANESALDKAVVDVALNRPADVSGIIMPGYGRDVPGIAAPARPSIADTARASHPDLMVRHDALTSTIDNIRAQLNPTDETIAHLRGQVDEITARIQSGGPQTPEQAARLGAVSRARQVELDEALARQAALAKGEAVETPYTASLRQQLLDAQDDLRALSPQMREALGPDILTKLAEEKALPPQAAPAAAAAEGAPPAPAAEAEKAVADARLQGAAAAEAPLPPMSQWQRDNMNAAVDLADKLGLTDEIRRLAEQGNLTAKQISEQLGGRLAPEEVRAVRDSMGIAPIGPAQAFGVPIPGEAQVSPEIRRLQKVADDIEKAPPTQKPVAPAPERPRVDKAPGESPEDKAVLDQAKQLIESPDFAVPPEKRTAYNDALKQEQEARVAAGCLGGGAI